MADDEAELGAATNGAANGNGGPQQPQQPPQSVAFDSVHRAR